MTEATTEATMATTVYIPVKFVKNEENIKDAINSQQKYIDAKVNDLGEKIIDIHDLKGERISNVGRPMNPNDVSTKILY